MGTTKSRADISAIVGRRVREVRQSKGMSLRQVAEVSGICIAQLSKLELGGRRVTVDDLAGLSEALDTPATTLLSGSYLWA